VLAWSVLVLLATYSVLVWVGRPAFIVHALPGWVDDDGPLGFQARAITISSIWLSAALFMFFGAIFIEGTLGIRPSDRSFFNPIDLLFLTPGVGMLVLWYASAGWMRPRWAIPAWFRKDLHRGRYAPVHRIPPPPGPGLWPRAWRGRIPHMILFAAVMIGGSISTGDIGCRRARGDVDACEAMVPSAWAAGIVAGVATAAVGLPMGWFRAQSSAKLERLRRRNLRLASISSTLGWFILGAAGLLSFLRGGFAIAVTALLAWLGVVMLVVAADWLRRALRDRDIATLT
jgi:hypothetical protein